MKKLIYSVILTGAAFVSLVIVTSLGCGSPDQLGTGGNSGGGGTAGVPNIKLDGSLASKGGAGGGGGGGPLPTGDANCGSQTSNTNKQPVDVLLVLDRSGSMTNDIAQECNCTGSGGSVPACDDQNTCKDRWTTVSAALSTTLTSTPDINWGLKLYSTPGGSNCNVSTTVEVGIAANTAGAIQQRISDTDPSNNTPTRAAITTATAYLKTVSDTNNKVILLATDGQPNCKEGGRSSDPDVEATVAAIAAAKAAGFLVYVIGMGPEVGNLDNFAVAGGTEKHYPATSAEQLASALASISKAVATCTFALSSTPPDASNVAVYLDKNLVKQDAANGWSFGATNQVVVLNGDTCKKVTSGEASSVQVLFGCPGIDPPKVIP